MISDQDWYASFADVGEAGVFGRDAAAAYRGIFGGSPPPSPTVPSASPLSVRFGDNVDVSYLRIDLFSRTINNVKHPFSEWHRILKELLPDELLTIKQFKWIEFTTIGRGDPPKDDDLGDARDFPKSTLLWVINKFIRSEAARPHLRIIEFGGKFSPAIIGPLGDDDQLQIIQFIQTSRKLTHLRLGYRIVPPKYKDGDCALVSDEPEEQVDNHCHLPFVCGIKDKPLQHLEVVLGHFDAKSLGDLLEAPVNGELQRLSILFQPVHAQLQLGEFIHTMAASSLRNITHLALGLPSCDYNEHGRLPRFVMPDTPEPEHEPIYEGAAHDTYFTANMFDCASNLKLFTVNFGDHFTGHPLLDQMFGPDMRRFLYCHESRPEQVKVRFEGVRVVGCQFRTFIDYVHQKIPRLQISTRADEISVTNKSATVCFKVTRPRNCSVDTFENNLCRSCRSLYPVVLHTIALLALEYCNRHNVRRISTEYEVQDCVLADFTKDLNSCSSRQSWVWRCLPDIKPQANRRSIVSFMYANTRRVMEITFRNERCDADRNCLNCLSRE